MGLNQGTIAKLRVAMRGLEQARGTVPWRAIAALSQLAGEGMRLEIDLRASRAIGAAVIVAAPTPPQNQQGLTRRQREVASHVAAGQSNKAIARQLDIAVSTVKDHVHAILERTGARSRAELIALAQD